MVYSACMIVIQGSSWLTRMNLTRLLRYGLTNSFRKFKSVKTLATYVEQLALPGKLTEKALSLIQKGFNDQTDELFAAGCQIHKTARSRILFWQNRIHIFLLVDRTQPIPPRKFIPMLTQ